MKLIELPLSEQIGKAIRIDVDDVDFSENSNYENICDKYSGMFGFVIDIKVIESDYHPPYNRYYIKWQNGKRSAYSSIYHHFDIVEEI